MLLDVGLEQRMRHGLALALKPKTARSAKNGRFAHSCRGFRTFFMTGFKAVWPPLPPVAQNKVNGGGREEDDLGVSQAGRQAPLSPLVIYSLRVVPLAALPHSNFGHFLGLIDLLDR